MKCDLIINNHVVFTTDTRKPSHHCWNETFEFIHDFGNFLELHVTWMSPYRSLDSLIERTASQYRQLDFMLAGFSYLVFDEEKDQGFFSRVIELYPGGKVFIETFIKSRGKVKHKNHRNGTKSVSRSVISPSIASRQSEKFENNLLSLKDILETSSLSLKSDFRLLALLGTGHFGKIILCKRKATKQYYALKALKKAEIINNNEYAQILEEKKILTVITNSNHPFMVHLFSCLQDKVC